ncbi:MAG: FtsH protease activity modulator HflK [Nitrospirae bacterium]|nr:MAG: FtsH protease activity modulator HflK [Nitrospirota bacterium]
MLLAALLLWAASGIYIISPDEEGVVRRFGKAVAVLPPGFHLQFPRGIDRVDKVKVTQVKRLEIGFRTISPGPPARYQPFPRESLMLTGDENIVDCQLIVQYRIKDPKAYLFNVKRPDLALHNAAEVALRSVIGRSTIDDALTTGKLVIQEETRKLLQQIIDLYDAGILVTAVKLQTVQAPKQVEDAFKDVVRAKEDRERLVNEAKGYQEDVLPKARGEAAKIRQEAEAYRQERIARAKGEVARFEAVLAEYRKAKAVTRRRLYLEAMEEILPKVRKVVVDPKAGGSLLQTLPLGIAGGAAPAPKKAEGRR